MYRCTNSRLVPKKKIGKAEFCKFSRACSLPALENYEYCIKHILEDKTAPYMTCGYVYPINGKKCNQPAPKLMCGQSTTKIIGNQKLASSQSDRKEGGFCAEHTRKAQFMRQRAGGRHCPPQTVESLLSSLSHYDPNNVVQGSSNGMEIDDDSQLKVLNPFVDIDATKINLCGSRVLDYVSESDSDIEPATLESVWRDNDRDSSDAESVDSQHEDPLKHAGVYTAEEVALIVKEKMFRLQTLYYDQFKRLQHVLKERKRRYYHALQKEKEAIVKNNITSIHEQSKTSAKELKLYEKLKSLNQFHRSSGEEGILHLRVREKRNQAKKMKRFRNKYRISDGKNEGLSVNTAPTCKCIYTEGGVKCGLKTLPSSKYCRKHILEDNNQKLFRPCGCKKVDVLCQEPVLNIFDNSSCSLHVTLLPPSSHKNIESELSKEDIGAAEVVKCEKVEVETDIVNLKEEISSSGIKEDVCDSQNNDTENLVIKNESIVQSSDEKTVNKDTIMDDIMADVDVVEEIIPKNDIEQTSLQIEDSTLVENSSDNCKNDKSCDDNINPHSELLVKSDQVP